MRHEMAEIPLKYQKVIDLNLVDAGSEAMKAISTWNDEGLFVLSGGVGSGKTMAACCWAHNHEGIVLTAAHLARWPRYDDAQMRRLLRTPRLVIDDLGTEYMDDKGNFMAVLDEVIAYRAANDLATLITTNLTVEEFRKRYNERIADRIRDGGRFAAMADSSWRHTPTALERERVANAEEKLKAERHEKRERNLCKLHLYGEGVCNADCPQWKKPSFVEQIARDLADKKSVS